MVLSFLPAEEKVQTILNLKDNGVLCKTALFHWGPGPFAALSPQSKSRLMWGIISNLYSWISLEQA